MMGVCMHMWIKCVFYAHCFVSVCVSLVRPCVMCVFLSLFYFASVFI